MPHYGFVGHHKNWKGSNLPGNLVPTDFWIQSYYCSDLHGMEKLLPVVTCMGFLMRFYLFWNVRMESIHQLIKVIFRSHLGLHLHACPGTTPNERTREEFQRQFNVAKPFRQPFCQNHTLQGNEETYSILPKREVRKIHRLKSAEICYGIRLLPRNKTHPW